jgi:hypothetical protein
MLIQQIASEATLNEAYAWLCHRRRDYPSNADIWSFRRNWDTERKRLKDDLLTDSFRFDALDRVELRDGSHVDVWTSRDALVLKAMSLCLAQVLPVSPQCTHVKGNGGAKRPSARLRGMCRNRGSSCARTSNPTTPVSTTTCFWTGWPNTSTTGP